MFTRYLIYITIIIVILVIIYKYNNHINIDKKICHNNSLYMIQDVYTLPPRLNKIMGFNFYAKKVPGDNSCFYHSLLFSTSSEYKSEQDNRNKKQMVKKLRNALSSYVTNEYWEKELSGFIEKDKIKNNLSMYNEWASSTEWKVVVDYMKINIIMFRQSTDNIYCGWGIDNFNPNYKTIFILNIGDSHYDPIIFINNDKIKTIFNYSSPIIHKIIEHGKKSCT